MAAGWKVILGPGLRVKVFGPGTHNAPFFLAGEVSLPRLEKETFVTSFVWGQWTINVGMF